MLYIFVSMFEILFMYSSCHKICLTGVSAEYCRLKNEGTWLKFMNIINDQLIKQFVNHACRPGATHTAWSHWCWSRTLPGNPSANERNTCPAKVRAGRHLRYRYTTLGSRWLATPMYIHESVYHSPLQIVTFGRLRHLLSRCRYLMCFVSVVLKSVLWKYTPEN